MADLRRYQGWIAMETTAQMKKPVRMDICFGT